MPQHGFARSTVWQWEDLVMDTEAGISIRLSTFLSALQWYKHLTANST